MPEDATTSPTSPKMPVDPAILPETATANTAAASTQRPLAVQEEEEALKSSARDALVKKVSDARYLFGREKSTGRTYAFDYDARAKTMRKTPMAPYARRLPLFALEQDVVTSFVRNFSRGYQHGWRLGKGTMNAAKEISTKAWDFIALETDKLKNNAELRAILTRAGFQSPPAAKKAQTNTPMTFKETDINWKELAALGITPEKLDACQRERLVEGKRTGMLYTSKIQTEKQTLELREQIGFKLQLTPGLDGKAILAITFRQNELKLPDTLSGETLTAADKDTLERTGHLGRPLKGPEGTLVASIDKELNTVSLMRSDALEMPVEVKLKNGNTYELTKFQREELKQGKMVPLVRPSEKVNDGYLVLNAATSMLSVMRPQKNDLTRPAEKRSELKAPPLPRPGKKI